MFTNAKSFKQDLNDWDVSNVSKIYKFCMFDGTKMEKLGKLPDWY
jgi:surface protein